MLQDIWYTVYVVLLGKDNVTLQTKHMTADTWDHVTGTEHSSIIAGYIPKHCRAGSRHWPMADRVLSFWEVRRGLSMKILKCKCAISFQSKWRYFGLDIPQQTKKKTFNPNPRHFCSIASLLRDLHNLKLNFKDYRAFQRESVWKNVVSNTQF